MKLASKLPGPSSADHPLGASSRRRSLVERKLTELKSHGMGHARYRGNRKVLLQIRLTAALVNVKKLLTSGIVDAGALGA